MHGQDPFPTTLLLGQIEIRRLLSMDKNVFAELLKDPEARFPLPVKAGRTKAARNRKRWHKHEVYAWIALLGRDTDPA